MQAGSQPGYGAPQAGYGPPQGGYGTPPAKKKTGLILGIVGGVVVLGVIVTVLLLVLGGGNGPSSDDPAETVQSFLDAGKDRDCDAVKELVTGEAKTLLDAQDCDDAEAQAQAEALGFDPDDITYEVGEASIDGDRATVPVTTTFDGDLPEGVPAEALSQTIDYELAKVDGSWLISSFGFDAGDLSLDDLPTDLPTDAFPTDAFPTDLPTEGIPTDFPTDFLTEFPTDGLPSDFFSDFPTELFSDFPTDGFPTQ